MATDIEDRYTVEKMLNEFMGVPLYTGRNKYMLDDEITMITI